MNWYNIFSNFYDLSIEGLYKKHRKKVFSHLMPDNVDCVLDFACGTGQNFPHLKEALGENVHIIGIDLSEGMLNRARKRVAKTGLKNVHLIQCDARNLSREDIEFQLDRPIRINSIVTTLALVVVPDWEEVFQKLFDLLEPGGQFIMMEVWAEKRVPQTFYTELVARADLRRKVWEPLEKISANFKLEFLKGSPHIHGGRLFYASGFKAIR